MVMCNDGMAVSHDGAHDCQVPQAQYVVVKLAADTIDGSLSFREIQIFSELELGRNNLSIETDG